jgi:hypothetical protein
MVSPDESTVNYIKLAHQSGSDISILNTNKLKRVRTVIMNEE